MLLFIDYESLNKILIYTKSFKNISLLTDKTEFFLFNTILKSFEKTLNY